MWSSHAASRHWILFSKPFERIRQSGIPLRTENPLTVRRLSHFLEKMTWQYKCNFGHSLNRLKRNCGQLDKCLGQMDAAWAGVGHFHYGNSDLPNKERVCIVLKIYINVRRQYTEKVLFGNFTRTLSIYDPLSSYNRIIDIMNLTPNSSTHSEPRTKILR